MPDLASLRTNAIQVADSAFFKVLSFPNLAAVQIGILLGSFYLFNGKPCLGFGILGSAVKCAQVIGLHRQSRLSTLASGNVQNACRVWWTLEIFDKQEAILLNVVFY